MKQKLLTEYTNNETDTINGVHKQWKDTINGVHQQMKQKLLTEYTSNETDKHEYLRITAMKQVSLNNCVHQQWNRQDRLMAYSNYGTGKHE